MRNTVFCILASVLLVGCSDSRWFRDFELDADTFDREAMQMIVEDSGLTLPTGARGLNFRYSPPIDPSFVARVQIPEEALDNVLKQIEAIQNEDINISGGPGQKVDWWPPPRESIIADRQCHQPDNDYLRVVLTREGNRTILYVSHAVF
jgi:hypothetical protein